MSNPDYFNDVIILTPFDNASGLLDVKGHQISAVGSPVINSSGGKFNTGNLQLNGSQYLQVASSPDLSIGLSDYTVEIFFNPTVAQTSCLYSSEINYVNTGAALYMTASAGTIYLQYYIKDTGIYGDKHVLMIGTTPITLNSWHTAAMSRVNGVLNLFLDGNLEATQSPGDLGGGIDFSGGSYIGKDFVGELNDFRLSINFGYAAAYLPKTTPFSILVAGIDVSGLEVETANASISGIDIDSALSIDMGYLINNGIDFGSQSGRNMVKILIKRTITINPPPTLNFGELAWSENGSLYVGRYDGSISKIASSSPIFQVTNLIASENLQQGAIVTMYINSSGVPMVRNANASLGLLGQADGYVNAAVMSGGLASIIRTKGTVFAANYGQSLVVGSDYYLSDINPGQVVLSPPGSPTSIKQFIGKAFPGGLAFDPAIAVL